MCCLHGFSKSERQTFLAGTHLKPSPQGSDSHGSFREHEPNWKSASRKPAHLQQLGQCVLCSSLNVPQTIDRSNLLGQARAWISIAVSATNR
ncbi:hypothetical protein RUM44_010537 [Polyplax serrata]|uniref:Uncharacterized protein n=1 Tax=Polyplax serrata TaxID=468196 RepID=A0ABR1AVW1_POLSC